MVSFLGPPELDAQPQHCQDAAEVGWLKPGIEPEQLAHMVIGTMQGMILLAKVSNTSAVAVSEAMDRAIEHGVRSRSWVG
jgi:hypothetical protein